MVDRQLQQLDQSPHVTSSRCKCNPQAARTIRLIASLPWNEHSFPARELQAIHRCAHPSHRIDVERHARDFMEAAKKLQLYFIGLQHQDQRTKEETLRKEIAVMEEELKTKSEMIKKHEKLIRGWRKESKDQLDKHMVELQKV